MVYTPKKANARHLHRHGGKYVFIVKRNRPSLPDQLAALPWSKVLIADQVQDKGHDRRETRTLQVVSIKAGIGFPQARLVTRLTRNRTHTVSGVTSRETVYAVTNLDWQHVTAAQLGQIIRGHGATENRVHHVRDTTFDEDRSQVRTGTGPRVMATRRNIAIGQIRTAHTHRQHHRRHPNPGPTSRATAPPPRSRIDHTSHNIINFELTLGLHGQSVAFALPQVPGQVHLGPLLPRSWLRTRDRRFHQPGLRCEQLQLLRQTGVLETEAEFASRAVWHPRAAAKSLTPTSLICTAPARPDTWTRSATTPAPIPAPQTRMTPRTTRGSISPWAGPLQDAPILGYPRASRR